MIFRDSAARAEPPQPHAEHQPIGSDEPGRTRRCGHARHARDLASRVLSPTGPLTNSPATARMYAITLRIESTGFASVAVMTFGSGRRGITGSERIVPGGDCGPR